MPADNSDRNAAKQAPPSGATNTPSLAPTSRVTLIISLSGMAMAPPPELLRIFSIRKSPTAFGTRKPEAIVCASGNSAAAKSPASKCPNDWRATARLHREHARPFRVDPAERFHFIECFPHPDESGSSAGRIKNNIGQFPIELLGQLVAKGFFALDAIRFFQGRHVEPAFGVFSARDFGSAIGDQTIEQSDMRAELRHSMMFARGVSRGMKICASNPARAA